MTKPIAEKIGVANLGNVYNQTNHITIHERQQVALVYSDPVPDIRYFQGRKAELSEVNTWLADKTASIIGIRGEGGIGKSTLAAKVFAECPGFVGKFWADVRQGTSITALAERALKELGVPLEQVQAIEEKNLIPRLLRQLQQGRYLLAIDNLESVLTATGDWQSGYDRFLDGFRPLGSESVLLLSSREYPPNYFGWQGSKWLLVDQGLAPAEGAALLAALEVEDTDKNRAAVSEQVQGHPLALSLIAGWLRSKNRLGDRQVDALKQQSDWFQLEGEHRGERQISVESVFQWSMDRVMPEQQHLLRQVSVFRGSFNAEAATAVAGKKSTERSVSDANLDDLERFSLLEALPERDKNGLRRFRLQPRIREFVQNHTSDLSVAHQRAIDYFWDHRQTEFAKDDTQEAVTEYEKTFYHQCQLERYQDAAKTAFACDAFLTRRGYSQLLVDLYGKLYRLWHPAAAQHEAYTDVCIGLGNASQALGQYQQAIDYLQQALAIKREIGDRNGEANALIGLGLAYYSLGQYQQAIDYLQQALAITQEIGDRHGEANALINLGQVYRALGQYQQAIDYLQQALAIKREIGDRNGEAYSLLGLGATYFALGQYHQAIDYLQQVLAITREIGDRNGEAYSLLGLGTAYESLGQYHQAIDYLQQALAITREIGERDGEANSLNNLGSVYRALGQYHQAIDYLQQALAITREIGERHGEANSLSILGSVYRALGQCHQAIEYLQQALAITREIGDRNGEANALNIFGTAYESLGQYQQAIDYLQQALAIKREIGDRNGEAYSLLGLGTAYKSLGQYHQAIDYLQQALAIKREIGDRHGEANTLNIFGSVYRALGQCHQAIDYLQQALAIFEDLKLDHMAERCREDIAKAQRPLQRLAWWQKWGRWFAAGLAIALLIWWLTK